MNKSYTVIILEFCPHKMKTTIRGHPKYDSIINNPLKLMDAIYQLINEPIYETYPYMSLTEYLSIMVNTSAVYSCMNLMT